MCMIKFTCEAWILARPFSKRARCSMSNSILVHRMMVGDGKQWIDHKGLVHAPQETITHYRISGTFWMDLSKWPLSPSPNETMVTNSLPLDPLFMEVSITFANDLCHPPPNETMVCLPLDPLFFSHHLYCHFHEMWVTCEKVKQLAEQNSG